MPTPVNDTDDDEDDSEIDEDDGEENLGIAVSAELDSSRWHRSQTSEHLVLLDLLALLLVTETLQTIGIQKVPPPPPEEIVIEKTSVEIVDQWAQHRHIEDPGLTETDLRTQFPSLPLPLSRRNTVNRSVHCECTLVMKIVNDLVQQGTCPFMTLEVGVSKSLYNLCKDFMGLIKKWYPNITIMVSTHHGKNVAGWRLPPLVPLEISWGVEDHVQSSIAEIRSKAIWERRSDPKPRIFDSAFGQEAAAVAMRQFNPPVEFLW